MRKRGSDDVSSQVFHSRLIPRPDAVSAEDPVSSTGQAVKPGMPPVGQHGDHFPGDLPLCQKHLEDLVLKYCLYLFQFQRRSDTKHAPAVEAAVRHHDVTVGIESEKVAEGLNGDYGAGDGILFRDGILKKYLQRVPGATAQIGEKSAIIEKIAAQYLRDAKDEMAVGNLF